MHVNSGRNNVGVEIYGTDATMLTPTAAYGMENARTLEFVVDLQVVKFNPTVQANAGLAALSNASSLFTYDAPAVNTAVTAALRFRTSRVAAGSVTKSSGDGVLTSGERTVLRGLDNGTNVYMWQDGAALGVATSQADWTAAQLVGPVSVGAIWFGLDQSAATTKMIVYEAWIRVNGLLVMHLLPKWSDRGEGTILDRSGYGNHATFGAGVEDTDYRFVKAWGKGTP